MRQLRWGVLGVAGIALRAVIPAIQRSASGRLLAIASRTREKAAEAAGRLGIPRAYESYEAMLADPEVEAVYIPLPNSMHREWTLRCAEAGKHVLCEKPMALRAADAEEMIAACRGRGVALMEAFMYRFHPRTSRVAELAEQSELGEVRLVRASFTFRVRSPENIRLDPGLGGGGLYDVGCYCVNVSRMLLGEPTTVFAFGGIGASGVDEVLGAVLRFEGDRVAMIDCGLALSRRQEVEVVGEEGRLVVPVAFLPSDASTEIHVYQDQRHSVLTVPGVDQYQVMVDQFAEVARGVAPPLLPPEDAVSNLRVIEALYRSLRSGRAEGVGGQDA